MCLKIGICLNICVCLIIALCKYNVCLNINIPPKYRHVSQYNVCLNIGTCHNVIIRHACV
jgi:hypothetical protein